jgi:TrkA domain protein
VSFQDGGELVVLIHNEGRREVYWRASPAGDSEKLFAATERQARKLAEIFDGTYFEPIDSDLDKAWEDAVIEWVQLPTASPVIGQSIRDAGIRTKTGTTVIAVQRGSRTVSNPDSGFQLERGDVLVAVGTEAAHQALEALLAPDEGAG